MPSSPRRNAKADVQRGYKTPGKADDEESSRRFAEYGLSPPVRGNKSGVTLDKAVRQINKDFKKIWESGKDDEKKILVFLYSRGFHKNTTKPIRCGYVKQMLQGGVIRERILQVIKADGDIDRSSIAEWQLLFVRACLTLHRYFQQDGATGFIPDMSSLTLFLRYQKHGSCFLQAACVTISYMIQSHGQLIPPADASRLIRHEYKDEQLFKYIVEDTGGDSCAILQILEKKFFECDFPTSNFDSYSGASLLESKHYISAVEMIGQGPGLVSKFGIPDNFHCLRADGDELPGIARFTEWNEAATFVPLDSPGDEKSIEMEKILTKMWQKSCVAAKPTTSPVNPDDLTIAMTESISFEEGNIDNRSGAHSDSQGDASLCGSEDSSCGSEDSSCGSEDSSCGSEDSSCESEDSTEEDSEAGEGDGIQLHAMVLLGIHVVGDETFWVMQNSWATLQIIEMSTQYLAASGARLVFYLKKGRSPRALHQCSVQTCPSPIAESGQLERMDSESWEESLVFSGGQEGARNEA
jgi:hypothetical protein